MLAAGLCLFLLGVTFSLTQSASIDNEMVFSDDDVFERSMKTIPYKNRPSYFPPPYFPVSKTPINLDTNPGEIDRQSGLPFDPRFDWGGMFNSVVKAAPAVINAGMKIAQASQGGEGEGQEDPAVTSPIRLALPLDPRFNWKKLIKTVVKAAPTVINAGMGIAQATQGGQQDPVVSLIYLPEIEERKGGRGAGKKIGSGLSTGLDIVNTGLGLYNAIRGQQGQDEEPEEKKGGNFKIGSFMKGAGKGAGGNIAGLLELGTNIYGLATGQHDPEQIYLMDDQTRQVIPVQIPTQNDPDEF